MRIKNFTFFTAIIAIFALAIPQNTYSQVYQFENPGFEQWDGGSDNEPTGWNSYPSANCTMIVGCSSAIHVGHERSTDKRPGSTGSYSCCIYSVSVLGVVANGALTSGQMQLSSLIASNSSNGNRTITTNNDFNHRLNAKPDSIVFWAKTVNASNTSLACCHLYIHDNYNLQDPLGGNQSGYEAHIVGKVPSYNFTNNGSTWQRHSAPIEYDGCQSNDPQFILITFSTNKDAMSGSSGDKLYIDDIELIYNANLSSIKVNGRNIPNFNQNTTEYYVDVECGSTNELTYTTASPRASHSYSASPDGKTVTINVTHGDKAKTYTVHYRSVITNRISDEICKGDSYSQNGFTLPIQNSVGTTTHQLPPYQLANGCDSVVELSLTVHNTYTTNLDITICESNLPYNFFGQTIANAGTYQHLLTSQHGCDSTINLNLLVDDYNQVNIPEHICEGGDEYHNYGFDIEYSEIVNRTDNVIFDTLFFAAGTVGNTCDSIVILRLEVGRIDDIELTDSVEIDFDYNGNGFEIPAISEEGNYTFVNTFINEEGCDSIVTLTLKVLPKPVTPEPEPTPEVVTFDIFPNPTSTEQITVRANYDITQDIYEYQIFNELGMLMDTGVINSKDTIIDVSKYNTGYYYFKVLVGDKKEQKKRKAIKFMVAN